MGKETRTTAERWVAEGLFVLRELGQEALTIERLCGNLGRTKGSFYHHFKDLSVYLDALLARWEARDTEGVILRADVENDVRRRRARLQNAVRRVDTGLDVAVRAWGLRDPRAGAVMNRVDDRRIGYLAELYRLQGLTPDDALRLARLEYAAFVGAEQLFGNLSAQSTRKLDRTLQLALELVTASLPPRKARFR